MSAGSVLRGTCFHHSSRRAISEDRTAGCCNLRFSAMRMAVHRALHGRLGDAALDLPGDILRTSCLPIGFSIW